MYSINALLVNASRQIRLRDGSRCRIRPTGSADRHLLVDCFARLSSESRRMRFFVSKPGELSGADLDFFTGADGRDHIALVAVRLNAWGSEQEALGFARCIRLESDPSSAEISLAVADDTQRDGAGSALLGQLTRVARRAGIRGFRCEVLAENGGMRALAKQAGGVARWQGDGAVEHRWPLPGDTLVDDTFWSERWHEELGKSMDYWLSLVARALSVGFDHYEMILRAIPDTRSFGDLPYRFRWAQQPVVGIRTGSLNAIRSAGF